jgi:N-acetylglucosamine malate deacetylase 2
MDWNGRVMIVAPHPDDEAIGAGGHLADVPDAWVVLVTDGAPRNPVFAQRSGFNSREEYAQARRKEIEAALQVASIAPNRMISFGMVDQEAALQLVELTNRLAGVFEEIRPDTVLTPAYEGGHPDHDSVAFGVEMASRMMPPGRAPKIFEYALYNAGGGQYSTGRFLENSDGPVETVELAERGVSIKKNMYDCYATQRAILDRFDVHRERFRKAPEYDFERSPHEGPLYYDKYNWDVTGEKWRALAREARRNL